MTAPATLDRINDFPGLVSYLRDGLEWEIPEDAAFGDLTFNWTPSEIGLDLNEPIEITQLRPLRADQRWGVFFLNFPHGKLPVTLMRRILRGLSKRKRASANASDRAAWDKDDLIFISAVGDAEDRRLSFAHFQERGSDLPTLRVIGWDKDDTVRRLSHTDQVLRSKLRWLHREGLPLDWRDAFTERPRESVRTAKEMAEALAVLARDIRDRIKLILPKEKSDGDLRQLFDAVKQTLSRDLNPEKFADTYAQTIAYGLLSARINQVRERDDQHEAGQSTELKPKPPLPVITADAAGQAMPTTNPFLKELFGSFLSAGGRDAGGVGLDFDELGVGEVVDLLNAADMEAVLLDFDKHKAGDDPVIHFYEGFLHAYDKALKVQRGVFYTPRPVVSYIVRSVDEVLRNEFGLVDGLADVATWDEFVATHPGTKIPDGVKGSEPFVKILDPATGTGTFLVEVIDLIYATMTKKWKAAGLDSKSRIEAWNDYVPRHLLPRLYGFELMMAPYAVAHMKLGLKLADTGYRFDGVDESGRPPRARVFLTNALEPARDLDMELSFMSEALAHEAMAANEAKASTRFSVLIGNPPYAKLSSNKSKKIDELMEKYKTSIAKEEIQRQALSNDYVKFFAFSFELLSRTGTFVFSFITDNSFLDGPLFRDMRQNIIGASRSGLTITDVGGNTRRAAETGSDENVFDIQQGVAITLSRALSGRAGSVEYGRIRGDREEKARSLSGSNIIGFEKLIPVEPTWWLVPRPKAADQLYGASPSLLNIFAGAKRSGRALPFSGAALATRHDKFAIAMTRQELEDNIDRLLDPSITDAELINDFSLCSTSHFTLKRARDVPRDEAISSIRPILYRPFDTRWVIYHPLMIGEPRPEIMGLMLHNNLALLSTRRVTGKPYDNVFISNGLVEYKAATHDRNTQVFPLFLKPTAFSGDDDRGSLNISTKYLNVLREIDAADGVSIFGFIYALLHSPAYRARYQGRLEEDYARIPVPASSELFQALVPLGAELVALHLFDLVNAPMLAAPMVRFVNPNSVEARLDGRGAEARRNGAGRIYVNDACWFETVPASVWEHWIGGYQPAQKWLKDRAAKGGKNKREGRVLTVEDQLHYRRMITALARTAELMGEIDVVIARHGGWPGAFTGITD
jgi:type I restriction-modification system DNA methylase subunit